VFAGRRGGTGAGSATAADAAPGAAGGGAPAADGDGGVDSEPMMLTGGIEEEDGNSYFDDTGTPDGDPGGAAGSALDKSASGGPRRAVAQLGAYLATSALNGLSRRFDLTRLASLNKFKISHWSAEQLSSCKST
jgi:hypothetical protein